MTPTLPAAARALRWTMSAIEGPWHRRGLRAAMHAAAAMLLTTGGVWAQQPAQEPAVHDMAHMAAPASGWAWTVDGNAFVGFNGQRRKFRDFSAWESQNWLMGMGTGRVAGGTLLLQSMWSFEPFTLHALGSPQVFQTGETFRTAPLIDYQHPHDLIMGLGASYRRPAGPVTLIGEVDLVGSPALGPTAFMHRPSAMENPQAPLSHHYTDSTHITPGVITTGIEAGAWRMEGSWFRGKEPDENRTDLDLGALDSYSARVSWTRGGWSAQASAADLTLPEATTPYDARKFTGSVAYASEGPAPRAALLAAVGQNREIHGNLEAYLFEATFRLGRGNAFYMRAESVAKDILDAGFHPRGVFHRHRQSQVGAVTFGYIRDLFRTRAGPFGLGADITSYRVPANLADSYGYPLSVHVFLRQRFSWPSGGRQQPGHEHGGP